MSKYRYWTEEDIRKLKKITGLNVALKTIPMCLDVKMKIVFQFFKILKLKVMMLFERLNLNIETKGWGAPFHYWIYFG